MHHKPRPTVLPSTYKEVRDSQNDEKLNPEQMLIWINEKKS